MLDSWPQPLGRVVEDAGRSGVAAAAAAELDSYTVVVIAVLYIRTVAAAAAVDSKPRIAAVAA